jgi:hypothetical protein
MAMIPVKPAATIFVPRDGFSPGLRFGHKAFLTYFGIKWFILFYMFISSESD